MKLYEEHVVPYLVELTCSMKELVPARQKAVEGLFGDVLEIGFGSGLNVPHYPAEVRKVLAVEPSSVSQRIGHKRVEQARCAIQRCGLQAERIQAPDASVDAALSTFTLCTIPDAKQALREVRRVLKVGGRLHFLEHGRAPDAGVARWQDRLNGVQRAFCGGCNLNRDIRALVEDAGFRIESLETGYFPKAPRTHAYMYQGVALRV